MGISRQIAGNKDFSFYLSYFIKYIRKFVYSEKCPVCGRVSHRVGRYVCDKCWQLFRVKNSLRNTGKYYFVYYYDGEIKKLIADFKLQNRRYLGIEIAELIKMPLKTLIKEKEIDAIIPVPISTKRYNERGFNQVEELLTNLKLKFMTVDRIRDTKHMYELLSEEERQKNIKNAFRSRLSLDGKNILIVDDIVTTGKTIRELISEIKRHSKPKDIYVFSVAQSKIFREKQRFSIMISGYIMACVIEKI